IEVVIALLDVFSVTALPATEPEETLFQDGILTVPKGRGKTDPALAVGPAHESVFAPAISAAAGLIMGEVFPTLLVPGIVLAHRAPLSLGQISAPAFPILLPGLVFSQTSFFRSCHLIAYRAGKWQGWQETQFCLMQIQCARNCREKLSGWPAI